MCRASCPLCLCEVSGSSNQSPMKRYSRGASSLLRTKQSVVLYVAHNNQAAKKVYERVGFVGFAASGAGATDSWKELGFDPTLVRLGHW